MYLLDESIILSPSDLAESLACDHLTALNLSTANGLTPKPTTKDPGANVLSKRGDEHELKYLQSLIDAGKSVATIERTQNTATSLFEAQAATLDAMRTGVDIIFQGTFFDGRWRGLADFLEKCNTPSDLGDFSYEIVDTKLARHAKSSAVLQIANYSDHIARLQGVTPQNMHLQLGDGTRVTFKVHDFDAYYRTIKARFEQMVDDGINLEDTYPDPVAHCAVCDWVEQCVARRVEDDHLSLVAGMGRHQVDRLKAHGIATVAELGTPPVINTPGIGTRTLQKLHDQARMQLQQRKSGDTHYELLDAAGPDKGFSALPEPSPGDLFFDMEGDPYAGPNGLEYLFGVTEQIDGELTYKSWWGHDDEHEKKAFEDFIDFVMQRLATEPNMHIYHYAPYEVTAMKKLAGRHATRETEVDQLLRGHTFVDLYQVVRQSIRISQDSYSIKKLEPFYMGARETDVVGGGESIEAYERWIELQDQSILDDIEAYNNDDCDSTLHLRNWLEKLRTEAEDRFGPMPRLSEGEPEPPENVKELDKQINAINTALLTPQPDETAEEQHAKVLLGRLLEWHRRESKAEWWRHFELKAMGDDELFEDREAISGLTYEGVVGTVKRSTIHRYRFDPSQDHKIKDDPIDPQTGKGAGTVDLIDDEAGIIDLVRGNGSKAPHPTALIPPGPVRHDAQQQALIDVGRWVAEHGLTDGEFGAARDLLLRRPPQLTSGDITSVVATHANATAAAVDLALTLDQTCLAIQGPPGAGKTYAGAEMVLALVRAKKKVGITANSHKVIGNVLQAIADHAAVAGESVRIMQKADKEKDLCPAQGVQHVGNEEVEEALAYNEVDVVAGTAWLFARSGMREALDVLIVDEAGQMSLADVMAVSTCAKSTVLLGDPQQLAQPSKGVHPDGAEKSALGHLLGDHQTMLEGLGLLLDNTWRMHPDVCRYISDSFYDGRLTSVPDCAQQGIVGEGTGLRYLEVVHTHNRTSSEEEAAAISSEMERLLECKWTNRGGNTQPVTLHDILVVAPYNAQVTLLQRMLPDGTRVGTVDKFQGQEAAVVFYSMAASTPDDISRGMEFLYSRNRLNVAISRAQCLAYLVCSPALFTINCTTAEQMRLANSLCALREVATQ